MHYRQSGLDRYELLWVFKYKDKQITDHYSGIARVDTKNHGIYTIYYRNIFIFSSPRELKNHKDHKYNFFSLYLNLAIKGFLLHI